MRPKKDLEDPTSNWSRKKIVFFSLITLLIGLIVLEGAAFLFFLIRGEVHGDLAFHPLFRSLGFRSSAFSDNRFAFDPFLAYRYHPNTKYLNLAINEHGFIDNGRPFPDLFHKDKNVTRIFLLGGSSLAGSGASSNATTIAAQLEKLLNEQRPGRYEVINAGVDGYFSYNELAYCLFDLINYQPDILIFYDGWNDFAYSNWLGGYKNQYQKDHCRPNYHEYALYLLTIFPQLEKNTNIINYNALFSKSYLTIFMKRFIGRFMKTDLVINNVDVRNSKSKIRLTPDEAAGFYTANVASAAGLAASQDIKVIYALQPTILDKPALTVQEKGYFSSRPALTSELSNPRKIGEFYAAVRRGYASLQEKFSSDPRVVITDLSPTMWQGVTEEVYLDEIHTNDVGNRIIAKKLSDLIVNMPLN